MFAVITDPGLALPTIGFAIVVYVVLTLYFFFRGAQPLELRLLVVGVLTAVLALWSGQFLAVDRGAAQLPAPQIFGGTEAAAALGRIAVLLILGGLGIGALARCGYPLATPRQEETRRDNVV